ncbi:MAG: pyridoxal-phosphate dependent enzyme [Bacteroidota bacterium]
MTNTTPTTPPLYIETPTYTDPEFNRERGAEVYFKMESFQPTRSFKIRGMDRICRYHWERGKRKFIASSGGNAGYSLAYAVIRLGGRVKVVVPESTAAFMRNKIAALGAEVEVHGEAWDEAHAYTERLARETGAVYVPPFDDPLLWEGHATIMAECARQIAEPDAVVVSVGGGGLLCGVLQGMEAVGWKRARVVTAETEGAASYAASLAAGRLVTLDRITTIAKTLGAKTVAAEALRWAERRDIRSAVVTDARSLAAGRRFADAMGVLVEPACGAALAAVYDGTAALQGAGRILAIACGGAGIRRADLV